MSGFRIKLPPPPPRVLAADGQPPCGERFTSLGGVCCERPEGHAGGHLSQSGSRYWQAEEPQS